MRDKTKLINSYRIKAVHYICILPTINIPPRLLRSQILSLTTSLISRQYDRQRDDRRSSDLKLN